MRALSIGDDLFNTERHTGDRDLSKSRSQMWRRHDCRPVTDDRTCFHLVCWFIWTSNIFLSLLNAMIFFCYSCFYFSEDTPTDRVCLFILMFQRSNVFNRCWLENCWKANRQRSEKNLIGCHIISRWIYCQSVSWKGRFCSAPSSFVLNLKMSEKRARVSPAFVYPLPEQQVPVVRNSGASSRATSDIFMIKPNSARNTRPYPELLRSTPVVKQQGFLRTILRGIRGESSVVGCESLFTPMDMFSTVGHASNREGSSKEQRFVRQNNTARIDYLFGVHHGAVH